MTTNSFSPPLFLSWITPYSYNYSVFCKPTPIKDQPLCSHSSIFHFFSPSSWNHEAQTTSLPTQLFLYISWPCQVLFPPSLFMSSHKSHTITILWIYLSISNPSSIDDPLFYVTEHSLEAQLTAKNSLEKKNLIFCICKNLLFTGEAMTPDSSHKKEE